MPETVVTSRVSYMLSNFGDNHVCCGQRMTTTALEMCRQMKVKR